jgi:hypothetical protein
VNVAAPSKWRFRFTIRALLVALTASAVGVGWFAHYVQERRAAFSAIKEAGGKFRMLVGGEPTWLEKWFGPEAFGPVYAVDMRHGRADNELLAHIGVLTQVTDLDLSDADVDDEGLKQIARLPLRRLWLQDTAISDASAATLSGMKQLRFLQLNATELTDEFLAHLEPLPQLDNLGLRGTKVTTAGMQHLARHPQLATLDIYSTVVDDDGVRQLVECRLLRNLGLSMTKVTDDVFQHLDRKPKLITVDLNGLRSITTEAVRAFEKSHPKFEFEWNGD